VPEKTVMDNGETLLYRYAVTDSDLRKENPLLSAQMLQYLLLIREFEQKLLSEFSDKGKVHGPLHSSIGQEAVAVGATATLQRKDMITSTHRGHHHFLAKTLFYYLPENYDPRKDDVPSAMYEICSKLMAEILGLSAGYCLGRGGSMHLAEKKSGVIGNNAIVGGGISIATGAALKEKLTGGDAVAITYFGEGAINQGVFAECANMAALWKLPVIFLLENNLYSVATYVANSIGVTPVAKRGLGFGLTCYVVDGMSPTAVRCCVQEAREIAVSGRGPVLIECLTYRYKHQGGSQDGTAFGYRTREEIEEWKKKDPCVNYPRQLKEHKTITSEQFKRMKETAEKVIQQACSFARRQPAADTLHITEGLHSDGSELTELNYRELEDYTETKKLRYVESISATLRNWMEKDSSVFVIGEEVGRLGGAFAATKGLYKQFPERTIDAPISEAGFTGMGLGAALCGSRPVVEIMYPDFTMVAADALMNQIPKVRYAYGNQFDVPLVVRTRCAIGSGYGAQHSLDPAAVYALYPGWRIVAPSCPFDVIGLLNTAMASRDPVLFIEHALLYNSRGPVPKDDMDFAIPFGKAKVYGDGADLVIVSYSYMLTVCLEAVRQMEKEGIHCTVVDLRTLDYLHIDWDCLKGQLERIGRMLICEQAPLHGSVGAQIADELQRQCFGFLDTPIQRVGSADIPVPVSKTMEAAAIVQPEDVIKAIRRALQ